MISYKTRSESSEKSQSGHDELITIEYSAVITSGGLFFLNLRKIGTVWHSDYHVKDALGAQESHNYCWGSEHTTTKETLEALKGLQRLVVEKRQKLDSLDGKLKQAIRTIE